MLCDGAETNFRVKPESPEALPGRSGGVFSFVAIVTDLPLPGRLNDMFRLPCWFPVGLCPHPPAPPIPGYGKYVVAVLRSRYLSAVRRGRDFRLFRF